MSPLIKFHWDAEKLTNLAQLGDDRIRGRVISRATKAGGRAAGVVSSKLVRQRFMKVKAGELKRHIDLRHYSKGTESYSNIVVDPSAKWPLARWQSGKINPKKPPKGGAKFRMIKGGGRFTVPGAFLASTKKAGSGRMLMWKRKGADRFPRRHIYTTAPMRYLGRREVSVRVMDRGFEQMSKEFDRYSKYVLSGGRGGIR